MTAEERWRVELAGWQIPPEILERAPESPWGFPVEMFRVSDGDLAGTPSRRRALEVLDGGGSVLDVGCGGGAASLALVPPATSVAGVDESAPMLAQYAASAERLGIAHREVLGSWPDVADRAGTADVVVCHHVAYNVPSLAEFAVALTAAARRRVVLELTAVHPLVLTAPLWRRFHGLDRPAGPDVRLARQVLEEAGLRVHEEHFARPPRPVPREVFVAFTRRRLCLPSERDAEVDAALGPDTALHPREVVTLWWDTGPASTADHGKRAVRRAVGTPSLS
jgi:SAM-dependent methyltransferase